MSQHAQSEQTRQGDRLRGLGDLVGVRIGCRRRRQEGVALIVKKTLDMNCELKITSFQGVNDVAEVNGYPSDCAKISTERPHLTIVDTIPWLWINGVC